MAARSHKVVNIAMQRNMEPLFLMKKALKNSSERGQEYKNLSWEIEGSF